ALEKIASNVTIVHRRDRFRAHEYSVKQMMDSSINVFTPFVPTELLGGSKLESIKLKHTKNKEVIELKANEYIVRSEEHTSELQSRFDLVCRLLLEKKKYKQIIINSDQQ